jgi:hypothetical protein
MPSPSRGALGEKGRVRAEHANRLCEEHRRLDGLPKVLRHADSDSTALAGAWREGDDVRALVE